MACARCVGGLTCWRGHARERGGAWWRGDGGVGGACGRDTRWRRRSAWGGRQPGHAARGGFGDVHDGGIDTTKKKEDSGEEKNKGRRKCSPRGSRVAARREWPTASTIGSRAKCSNTFTEFIDRRGSQLQPRLGSWPAAAEQAVERLLMRMVGDGNGRARAGRGRRAREWRGAGAFRLWWRFYKVVTACAWEARDVRCNVVERVPGN